MKLFLWILGLLVIVGPAILLVAFFLRADKKYLTEKNTKIDEYSMPRIPKGQTQVTVKKRFLFCPHCKMYTRYQVENSVGPAEAVWYGDLAAAIKAKLVSRRVGLQEVCGHCGNRNNLQKVFLPTIVERAGREVAFITPEGTQEEIQPNPSRESTV